MVFDAIHEAYREMLSCSDKLDTKSLVFYLKAKYNNVTRDLVDAYLKTRPAVKKRKPDTTNAPNKRPAVASNAVGVARYGTTAISTSSSVAPKPQTYHMNVPTIVTSVIGSAVPKSIATNPVQANVASRILPIAIAPIPSAGVPIHNLPQPKSVVPSSPQCSSAPPSDFMVDVQATTAFEPGSTNGFVTATQAVDSEAISNDLHRYSNQLNLKVRELKQLLPPPASRTTAIERAFGFIVDHQLQEMTDALRSVQMKFLADNSEKCDPQTEFSFKYLKQLMMSLHEFSSLIEQEVKKSPSCDIATASAQDTRLKGEIRDLERMQATAVHLVRDAEFEHKIAELLQKKAAELAAVSASARVFGALMKWKEVLSEFGNLERVILQHVGQVMGK
jgi:hypothetical protein